jgi:hypothetical protein
MPQERLGSEEMRAATAARVRLNGQEATIFSSGVNSERFLGVYAGIVATMSSLGTEEVAQGMREAIQLWGGQVSRPKLTASFVMDTFTFPLLQVALQHQSDDQQTFVLLYEAASVSSGLVNAIFMAEEDLAGRTEEMCSEMLSGVEELQQDAWPTEELDSAKFMAVEAAKLLEWREAAQEYSRLLRADPSGYLLIDAVLASIEDAQVNLPECVRAARIMGVRQAAEAYKTFYPMTQQFTV